MKGYYNFFIIIFINGYDDEKFTFLKFYRLSNEEAEIARRRQQEEEDEILRQALERSLTEKWVLEGVRQLSGSLNETSKKSCKIICE